MEKDTVIATTTLTVGDLLEMIEYMEDVQDVELTQSQIEYLGRQIADVTQAVIEDFIADLDLES